MPDPEAASNGQGVPGPQQANDEQLAALLASGGGASLQSLLAANLGGQSGMDPALLSLLAARSGEGSGSSDLARDLAYRMLEQRLATTTDVDDASDQDDVLDTLEQEELERQRERLERQRQRMQDLKRVLTSLYAEVDALRTRNDTIAAALGACYLCFGEDPACPECGGNGVPGSLQPDAAAFRQYVLPAMQRARAARAYRPLRASAPTRKDGDGDQDQIDQEPSTGHSTKA